MLIIATIAIWSFSIIAIFVWHCPRVEWFGNWWPRP
jgi:hypothetical protein